jgi:threonyl-tRNA synthetase
MDHPDHRRLGRELGIFATDEQVGAGLPLWLPAGAAIRAEIERFVVALERRHGYQHVYTPELGKRQLYERSGHWRHYEEDMYPPMRVGGDQVVLRLAELGTMFRLERSGVVGGLSRVRQMTLNDGHVFCAMEHIGDEIASILGMVAEAYRALAIPPPRLRLSLRGEGPKYAGDGAAWELSEEMLRRSLDDHGVAYDEASDEAAFYGPKIDLQVTDPQGREETLSTVQVDFYLPGRFDLSFRRGEQSERPVMIHRSIVSTMERMVAHLLEVHRGALPPWLAPTQVVVVPVAEDASSHGRAVRQCLHDRDVRVELDDRDATLASRIRDAQQRHVPYVAVVGRREAESGTVAVRLRDSTRLDPRPVDAFLGLLDVVIATRTAALLPAGGAS